MNLTDAMRLSLGHLRVCAAPPTRFVTFDSQTTIRVEVTPPGALIGRGAEADLRILDNDNYVSRRHALIEPWGLQWTIRDLGSSHGTRIENHDLGLALPPQVRTPIHNGDRIEMASTAAFTIELVIAAPAGVRTKDAPPRGAWPRLNDEDLLKLAVALLKPRRENPSRTTAPSAHDLAEHFHVERRTVYYWLEKLRTIPEVARHIARDRPSMTETADAVALAFPYLLDA